MVGRRVDLSLGGDPREVDTGDKTLSSELHHNLMIPLEINR